jgi:PBP1b-binding outer membrane lipoprotein LpoB
MTDLLLKQIIQAGKKMKTLIALILAGALLLLGCANQQNLTEEEKAAYRKANMRYKAGQRGP